jgi:hypothetical protein
MQLRIDQQVLELTIFDIQGTISKKLENKHKSQRDQAMASDIVEFLALQVLIPMLVSLCSSVLYDTLKGKALAKMRRKELGRVLMSFCGKTVNTNKILSEENVVIILEQLAPLGFTKDEIKIEYQKLRITIEKYAGMRIDTQVEQNKKTDNFSR